MRASEVWGPIEFRFTDPTDVARYGDGWWGWSEADLIRRPARELVLLESFIGIPLLEVMNGVRAGTVMGYLAATWISLHSADPELAGEFKDFDPCVLAVSWQAAVVDPGKEEPEPEAPDLPLYGRATSVPMDIVTLPNSPIAG